MFNAKMNTYMKKQYIQPATMYQSMNFISSICIGSVHGNALQYGGQDNSIDPM